MLALRDPIVFLLGEVSEDFSLFFRRIDLSFLLLLFLGFDFGKSGRFGSFFGSLPLGAFLCFMQGLVEFKVGNKPKKSLSLNISFDNSHTADFKLGNFSLI